jgi:predicted transcriptional regulator
MLRVRDIMTPDVVALRADQSLQSARFELASELIHGAPVCDADGKVIGVLSETDIVERDDVRPQRLTVEDAMNPVVWLARADDPALTAVRLMVEKGIHRVIVCDASGQPQGIVTPLDVCKAVARGDRFEAA